MHVESELKEGRPRGIVATSSLELGIDMGTVDLVVLVESPGSVARGIQRVGRAGHQVGEPSTGKIFPKYRGDLLEAAIVVRRMRDGLVEEMRYPRNPLDVLAQQIVAMCALDEWSVDDLYATVRRCANFSELSEDAFRETDCGGTVGGPDYDFGDHGVEVDGDFGAGFDAGFVADVGGGGGVVDGREEANCACAGEEVVRWVFGAETEFDCVALENMDEYMV